MLKDRASTKGCGPYSSIYLCRLSTTVKKLCTKIAFLMCLLTAEDLRVRGYGRVLYVMGLCLVPSSSAFHLHTLPQSSNRPNSSPPWVWSIFEIVQVRQTCASILIPSKMASSQPGTGLNPDEGPRTTPTKLTATETGGAAGMTTTATTIDDAAAQDDEDVTKKTVEETTKTAGTHAATPTTSQVATATGEHVPVTTHGERGAQAEAEPAGSTAMQAAEQAGTAAAPEETATEKIKQPPTSLASEAVDELPAIIAHSELTAASGTATDAKQVTQEPTGETAQQASASTTGATAADPGVQIAVALTENPLVGPRATNLEAMRLFRSLYLHVLAPAFDHQIWAHLSQPWQLAFPARTRGLMDMLDYLPVGQEDVFTLRGWFADWVKEFCTNEMNILRTAAYHDPGMGFNPAKYGTWCRFIFSDQWCHAAWLEPIYAHRNEWAWGVDGGTRGVAGFVEAVGLFVHIFRRMLKDGWAVNNILYNRACWEMKEYLYKWAIRINPPPAEEQWDVYQHVLKNQDDQLEGKEDDGSSSVYSDESDATIVPANRPATPFDGTNLDHEEYLDDASPVTWYDIPAGGPYGSIAVQDEEGYNDEVEDVQEPYSGGDGPSPEYTEAFPRYTEPPTQHAEPFPQFAEPLPQFIGPFPRRADLFPRFAEPSTSSRRESLSSGTATPRGGSQTQADPSSSAAFPVRQRARAQANAAALADDEDAELHWFAQFVLDREM